MHKMDLQSTDGLPLWQGMGAMHQNSLQDPLSLLLKQQTVDDKCLHTLVYEVESIMNGRPLTKVSDDPNDLEALMPNHLLLL